MDRRELLNELSKKYASETLEKYKECNYQYEEINKKTFFLHNSLIKNKFLFVMGISSFSFLIMDWFSVFSGNTIVSIIPSVVPTIIVPSMLTEITIGACALLYKTVRSVLKLDKKVFEYSNAKSEEEKIAAYLENKMEMARLKNKTLALSSSWKRSSDNVVLLYNLSIESTKEDESNQIIENMTQNLEKENEKLEQISLKNALNNALSSEEDDKKIMLFFGTFPFLFSLAVFPSLLSAGTIVATIGVGLAFSGSFINYTSKKTNKAVGNVLKKYNWTTQDMNKLPNESVDDVIEKIIAYDSTIYTKSVLKELNDFSRNNQGIMKSQNKANTLEDIKVPDSVLEQFVEAPVVFDNNKVFMKTNKE